MQQLNQGLAAGRQLTLVSAPAGFGKSTCISEWVNQLNLPVAWLSLDAADDDPARFFAYFAAALQKVNERLGRELESLLESGQVPPAESICTVLLDDILRFDRPFILVLDDFQILQERAILDVLEMLVANLPPQLHLVMVTREDPLLPLARLRANNQMTEIRAEELRFNSAEAGAFFQKTMGLSLSSDDLQILENRIEGWVAGLQLAGLSIQGRADPSSFIANLSGTHRYILGYLTAGSAQPPERRIAELPGANLDSGPDERGSVRCRHRAKRQRDPFGGIVRGQPVPRSRWTTSSIGTATTTFLQICCAASKTASPMTRLPNCTAMPRPGSWMRECQPKPSNMPWRAKIMPRR